MTQKYIWLFGENVGETANNNSYWFWKYIVNKHSDLDAYFIMLKNENNLEVYRSMNSHEKKCVIWRNSLQHIQKYFMADMLFVTLSYRDVQPDKIWFKNYKPEATQPLIYLQHGTLAMKQLDYKNNYANNSLFRWVYYNPLIVKDMQKVNGFKDYQFHYGEYLPRYMELVRKYKNIEKHDGKQILWFMTWREYFGNDFATKKFLRDVYKVVSSESLQEYLKQTNSTFTICMHRGFKEEHTKRIRDAVLNVSNIKIADASKMDVMDEIAKNDVLITDYSSLGFDFTVLNKSVILYQPDRTEYLKKRKMYCSVDELKEFALTSKEELINALVSEEYGVNCFFRRRLPEHIDLEKIEEGYYIEKMYQEFYKIQVNNIAFLGYDFTGIGGTVFATNALVEGLLEKGYSVRLFTLKRMQGGQLPAGAQVHPMYNHYKKKLSEKLKRVLFLWDGHKRYLKMDPAVDAIPPVSGVGMTFWMKHIHAKTVVSTRESLHFFLNEATSKFIKNKLYFFHTSSDLVDKLFPGAMEKMSRLNIEKALFVTEKNRQQLFEKYGLNNYGEYCVLGNSLSSVRSINRAEISPIADRIIREGLYLLRINHERADDIERVIEFGTYLQSNKIDNIIINVYGTGDYVEKFVDKLLEYELEEIIRYCGSTNDLKGTMKTHDFVVDFSNHQSFGMIYIESILNGKMVFCMHNEGSDEVLQDIPECFYNSYQELIEKVNELGEMELSTLEKNYDIISQKYSRAAIAEKFIDLL